ncbi:MAG: sulfatase [Flavobacteriales bacterium]|nr:sulfatase [Flavobacteriales bacterium]|tara:strand:+ start:14383 stop:16017 length:1635 start_codon:yes stop_codon:yes gene_type:complete
MKFYRIFSIAFLLIVTLCSFDSPNNTKQADKNFDQKKNKPLNIIYIMADDHAYQAISAYGSQISKLAPTPNIDRIANEGARMDAVYCTNSICGPSRASILTGKFSHVNGFYKNVDGGDFNGEQLTFPKIFQKNGYQTAVIGKWHLGTTPTGFDYSKVLINWGGQGTYYKPQFCINGTDTIVENQLHVTKAIENDCLDWLSKRDTTKPFMLLYQFKAPHRDWRPDSIYHELFSDFDFPLPETFNDNYEGRLAASENMMEIGRHLNRRDMKQVPPPGLSRKDSLRWLAYGDKGQYWSPSDTLTGDALKYWKFQTYIKDYLRCVAGIDRAVGSVLDYLEENGLSENTIVIYTSDQGFYLGEHGWFDKRWMYEESFKMPFVIKNPRTIAAGTVSDAMIMNVDFAPTMLDMVGIEVPSEMQGKSFKGVFEGNEEDQRKSVYYHYYEWPIWHKVQPHYGIKTDRYKLIHFYYSMDVWELYDLKTDPNEMNNIYSEASPELIADLKKELHELRIEYKDDGTIEEMKEMTDIVIKRVYNEPKIYKESNNNKK